MSKAKKTTTGWRQRYLVTTYIRVGGSAVSVLLMRGRMRKSDNGELRALVSRDKYKGWKWEVVGHDPLPWSMYKTFTYEAAQRPEMVGYVSGLRLQGYALEGEMPSW